MFPFIAAAAMRALPATTRAVVEFAKKYGNAAAKREFSKGQIESAQKAVAQIQPVRTAASKTAGAVKTQANKLVGRGNQVKRTQTGQAPQSKKTGKIISPKTVERYDRMGKRKAASRAKKAVAGTAAGTAVVEGGSALMNQKKTTTGKPSGQMKRNAPKSSSSASKSVNYNVGVSKGGVSFDKAFAHFRRKGQKTFTWNGEKFHTKLETEMPKKKKKK